MNGRDDDNEYDPTEDEYRQMLDAEFDEWYAMELDERDEPVIERDEPSDEFMFDRAMRIGRGLL